MAKDEYNYGRDKEKDVARSLRGKRAKVDLSEASKGARGPRSRISQWHEMGGPS